MALFLLLWAPKARENRSTHNEMIVGNIDNKSCSFLPWLAKGIDASQMASRKSGKLGNAECNDRTGRWFPIDKKKTDIRGKQMSVPVHGAPFFFLTAKKSICCLVCHMDFTIFEAR